MDLDWKTIANEPWIWICGAIICAIALYQCTFFMVRALRIMSRSGLKRRDIGGIVRAAAITSLGPVMAEIFVMVALVIALSAGFAWQREGAAVGSVATELVQASNAAAGAGQEFGTENFDMTGFANVVFVMNVSCIGWLIVAGLFTRYLGAARQKIAGGEVGRWDQDAALEGMGIGHCHVRRNGRRQTGGGVTRVSRRVCRREKRTSRCEQSCVAEREDFTRTCHADRRGDFGRRQGHTSERPEAYP